MQQPFSQQLVAGDTWSFVVSDSGFDPAVYALKYFFRGPGTLDLTATANAGGGFLCTATSVQTSALGAGTYAWQCVVVDADGNRTELGRGSVEVLANIEAQAAGVDGRSWVKAALDAVRNTIKGVASREEKSYQIAGRALSVMSPRELMELEGELAARYRNELQASGQLPAGARQVAVSFRPVGGTNGGWRP